MKRQFDGGEPGDIALGIPMSGNSRNGIQALEEAQASAYQVRRELVERSGVGG